MADYQRIEQLLKHLNMSARALAIALGLKNPQIFYDIKAEKCGISKELATKIQEHFLNISAAWLLTGEGSMLKDESPSTLSASPTPKISYTTGVPYYDVDFIGGFDMVMNCQTITPEYLIDFKMYNEATCWCNVTGHSMEPEINHGDIIALKKIDDFSFIPLGEVYAIVTTNGMRTIKRISRGSDNNHYTLVPTNNSPEYAPQEIAKSMISHVFQVLGCMKRI